VLIDPPVFATGLRRRKYAFAEYPRTAMCVRNVDVHVSCSSQVDAQLAAFFIDPRAKCLKWANSCFLIIIYLYEISYISRATLKMELFTVLTKYQLRFSVLWISRNYMVVNFKTAFKTEMINIIALSLKFDN
jgi:hypothetical protein